MNRRFLMPLIIVGLILFAFSCERMAVKEDVGRVVELKYIPLDYGELEAVTTDATYPDWAQLWFSDSSGVIRMVRVNWNHKTALEDIVIIGRN